jgi:hypothetical protein
MPKIIVPSNAWAQFDRANPVEIIDHQQDADTSVMSFTYRVRFSVASQEFFNNKVYLAFSLVSPIKTPKNMFKNQNIKTSNDAINAIKNFDKTRGSDFTTEINAFYTIDISFLDAKKGYVDVIIENKQTSYQVVQVYFFTRNANASRIIANTTFEKSEQIKRYVMPFSDFTVDSSTVKFNKRRIGISSNDKRIKKFTIYSANLFGAHQRQKDVDNEPVSVEVQNGQSFIDINEVDTIARSYRIVPTSILTGAQSSLYKEIVVNTENLSNTNCLIYATAMSTTSVSLTVASIPANCIALTLLRRNITQRETVYSTVQELSNSVASQIVLSKQCFGTSIITFEDRTLSPYNSYDYKVKMEFMNGDVRTSDANYTAFPQILQDVASIQVDLVNETIGNSTASRTFNASVVYKESSNTSKVLSDLKTLGIDNLFQNETKNLSTQLDPIIGILVTKTTLTSGFEERVGTFGQGQIVLSDSIMEDIVYRFEICIKSAPDVIEEIGASSDFYDLGGHKNALSPLLGAKILSVGQIQNSSNFTQKFFNKSVITKGQLKYGKTSSSSSVGVESGRTNIFVTFAYQNVKIVPKITTFKVIARNDGVILSWKAENLDDVDRFEVISNNATYRCIASTRLSNYFATIKGSKDDVYKLKTVSVAGETLVVEFPK